MRKFPVFKSRESTPGVGLCWLDQVCVFGFGNGTLIAVDPRKRKMAWSHIFETGLLECLKMPACLGTHAGVIALTMSGEIAHVSAAGEPTVIMQSPSRWIDVICVARIKPWIAFGDDRTVTVLDISTRETVCTIKVERAVTALAFGDNDTRLAAAHSGGVTLYTILDGAVVSDLKSSGGPVSLWYSPEGTCVLAGLAEPALVGWPIATSQAFKMGGYPSKPKQFAWHAPLSMLLTTGGPALLAWPFVGASGPSGQAARMYRSRLGLVTAIEVAGDQALVGWSDQGVDLIDLVSGNFQHLAGPSPQKELTSDPRLGQSQVVKVGFSPDGAFASWVDETGRFGVTRLK
jgi:WD40 repeat protein